MRPQLKILFLFMTALSLGAQNTDTQMSYMPLGEGTENIGERFSTVADAGLRQILVGFEVPKSDILEGLVVLLAPWRTDTALGRTILGPTVGKRPNPFQVLEKPGYYVRGIDLYVGLWRGQKCIKQIKIYWTQWNGEGNFESASYGIGPEKDDGGSWKRIRVPTGQIAVGIHGLVNRGMLKQFSLVTATRPSASTPSLDSPSAPRLQVPSQTHLSQPTIETPKVPVPPQINAPEGPAKISPVPSRSVRSQ